MFSCTLNDPHPLSLFNCIVVLLSMFKPCQQLYWTNHSVWHSLSSLTLILWDSNMEFRINMKVLFLTVAIVLTFLNIKERFFSERVKDCSYWAKIDDTMELLTFLDDSHVFVKKVIRDRLSNGSDILHEAWLQPFSTKAL